MRVDARIPSGTRQVLVLTVGDVEMSLGVTIFLGQAKIDNIDLVSPLANTHEKVIGLDVAVDEGLGVDVFDPRDQLIGQEQDRLQREFSVAEVEQIFQARS